MRITGLASVFFWMGLVGCVAEEIPEDVADESGEPGALFGIYCPGCTFNGFAKRASDYSRSQLNRTALRNANLWGLNGPLSLCTSMSSNQCTCRPEWSNWINNDTTATHVKQFTYIVKVAAPYGVSVHCGAYTYGGDAGLADEALLNEWSYRTQEVITGGLIAMLNTIGGVEVCLTTPDRDGGCNGGGYNFEETAQFGNIFRGYDRHIAGGRKLNGLHYNPERLKRPCTSDVTTACAAHIEYRYQSADGGNPAPNNLAYCEFANRSGYRHATRCRDAGGTWWNYPVTAHLKVAPEVNGYYFTEPTFERLGCTGACAREY